MSKIEIRNLYLIFGKEKHKAEKMLKEGKTKEEILKATGCTVAVKDANLSINEGEIFVIMGLSGSGKSTLLRCINRLIRPTSGEIIINDTDISKASKQQLLQIRRKELAMVFQHFGLLPHRSVLHNIAFGLELQGVEKEEREKRQLISEKKERAEMEASYVWRDLHQLENEAEQLKRSCEEKRREWESWVNEDKKRKKREEAAGYFAGWRIHPLEAVSMLGAFFVTFLLFHKPWNFLVAIVVALAEGLYVWNCLKDGKKKKKARLQEIKEQGISLKADYERQKGKLAKVQETYHEKEVLYENLQERVGEFDEMNSEEIERLKNKQGVELAMEQLTRLAAQMQSRTSDLMNTEVSAIMDAITDGKYNRLWVDENLHVQLMSNGKKISMDQVSRGTLEQIYFAIRMAATKILHEEECPVILDDAFGYYDDRRLAQTLRWLKDSKRQVIIFSCQKREMEMLEKMGCAYHKVML